MSTIDISVREGSSQVVLQLSGVIDATRLGDLLGAAVDSTNSRKPVVVDWSEAEHFHAGALQILLALKVELASHSLPLQATPAPTSVLDCLTRAGLAQTFQSEIVTTEGVVANGTDRR